MRTFLFAGASSMIAQEVARQLTLAGDHVVALTTKPAIPFDYGELHHVNSYSPSDLPTYENALNGLVYFPGTINLKPFNRLSEEDFLNEYRINALGAVNVIQKYLPNLKKASEASVVMISTVAVQSGMPYHASIAMAKGAIEGLTRTLAAELAPTVRVNAVAPSLTQTSLAEKLINSPEKLEASAKRHPLKRIGNTSDIASAINFLLSANSSWMTGQIIHIDGGMSSLRLL